MKLCIGGLVWVSTGPRQGLACNYGVLSVSKLLWECAYVSVQCAYVSVQCAYVSVQCAYASVQCAYASVQCAYVSVQCA